MPTAVATSADGTPVSSCQRIDAPGEYHLTNDLEGAPVEVSQDLELFDAYTGDRVLQRTCIEIGASDVDLDCQGHVLSGADPTDDRSAGIVATGTGEAPLTGITIADCVVTAHQFGVYVAHLDDGAVRGSVVQRNLGTGLYLTALSATVIEGNTVERNDPDGILVVGGTGLTFADNLVRYNRMRGLTLEGCQACTVRGNEAHAHGVIGFAIYGSEEVTLDGNVASDNRYHGFAILHDAGAAIFTGNVSRDNDGVGFYLEASEDNTFTDNVGESNGLDGVALLDGSTQNTFNGNTFQNNAGYGAFADAPLDEATFEGNTFAGNGLGAVGSVDPDALDSCRYKGGDERGWCDPVFEGGPNLKDPEAVADPSADATGVPGQGPVIVDAYLDGDPILYPAMGDLWMSTWTADDRVLLTWGDGTGATPGYPTGHPGYQRDGPVAVTFCPEPTYTPEQEGYFPCWLWRNVFGVADGESHATAPLTDTGVLAFTGAVPPEPAGLRQLAIDVPDGGPFFLQAEPGGPIDVSGTNDKPSSVLSVGGRLYLAGHWPAGLAEQGYLATSDDGGTTWRRLPSSPWGAASNFRVLMFVNQGRDHEAASDGYVYAFGVGTEASWTAGTVYLARVPENAVGDYAAYEYLTSVGADGPSWSPDESAAAPVDDLRSTGQGSAMLHEATGRYLFLTTDAGPPEHMGRLYEAPAPWGPWTAAGDLCFDFTCRDEARNPAWADGKYIAGLLPKGAGPDHVYFTVSGGDEHYQLQIGKLRFEVR